MNGRAPGLAERFRAMSDEDLGQELSGLGRSMIWPVAPNLAGRVVQQLETIPTRRSFSRWSFEWLGGRAVRRAAVLALIALLLVAGIATALGLGVPGIRILFGPSPTATTGTPPSASATQSIPSPSPSPSGLGGSLSLGHLASIPEAQAAADYPIAQPTASDVASPDEVWLDGTGSEAIVSFVWRAQDGRPAAPGTNVGLLLTEFRASLDRTLFQKMLGSGTSLEPVSVGGQTGYWITGRPHEVLVLGPSGAVVSDRIRLAGNVLMWTRGPLTLRLETVSGKDDALRIAASIR